MQKAFFKIIFIVVCISSCLVNNLSAQDVHYSQFYGSRLIVNPALTGFFNGQYRVGGQYRSQWHGFTRGYRTIAASAEGSLFKGSWKDDYIGVGVQFYRDIAGDAAFGQNSTSLSFAYYKSLDSRNRHSIAAGFQASGFQFIIDPNQLYFDNQYNGIVLDPNIPPASTINSASDMSFDFAAGLLYHFVPGDALNLYVGASAYQLLESEAFLLEQGSAKRVRRFTGHFSADIYVSRPLNILLAGMYLQQGDLRQINSGFMLQFYLDDAFLDMPTRFNIGAFLRYADPLPDAVVISARMDYMGVSLGMSYDFNISGLSTSSQTRGAYEISLFYTGFITSQGQRRFNIPCPTL